jgi:hypothetical protein
VLRYSDAACASALTADSTMWESSGSLPVCCVLPLMGTGTVHQPGVYPAGREQQQTLKEETESYCYPVANDSSCLLICGKFGRLQHLMSSMLHSHYSASSAAAGGMYTHNCTGPVA